MGQLNKPDTFLEDKEIKKTIFKSKNKETIITQILMIQRLLSI